MRLWTLHPKYLDARGLVALWREALLAQAVLSGQTRGYTHHPQLIRFLDTDSPLGSIAVYLLAVHSEAVRRSYAFDITKIGPTRGVMLIPVSDGQLNYEWQHLTAKLESRSPPWLSTRLGSVVSPDAHPLFCIIHGPVAEWEFVQSNKNSLHQS